MTRDDVIKIAKRLLFFARQDGLQKLYYTGDYYEEHSFRVVASRLAGTLPDEDIVGTYNRAASLQMVVKDMEHVISRCIKNRKLT